ncbi:uncharacterized protein LOC143283543 [Babylonia areolata]|uniref:uncharacterized protein LOC143283543 n=1 Tax=Babylonia areolata TaxID=304850 RepID=UPI003FD24F48
METSPLNSDPPVEEMSVDTVLHLLSTSTPGIYPSAPDLTNLSHHLHHSSGLYGPGDGNMTLTLPATRGPVRPPFRFTPDPFMEAISKVKYYGDPVIFAVGMLGNLLAYLVFTRTKFRKVPSVPYLSGMAVVDSGFVFTCFLTTLTYDFQMPIMSQMGVCQFGMFTNYACLFLAMWYLVALVTEKFISVFWPLKKGSLCTVFRAKVVLVCLAVLAVVSYSYVIYFFGPNPRFRLCGPWQEFQHPYKTFMVLDCVVVFIAPLVVIVALVMLIVVRGCQYYRLSSASDLRARSVGGRGGGGGSGGGGGGGGGGGRGGGGVSSSQPTTLRATELVYAVVVLVLVTHVPNSLVRVAGLFNTHMDAEGRRVFMRAGSVVRYLHLLSFAVKFLLYWLVSRAFREHAWRLLAGGKDRVTALCDCDSSMEADPQRIILRGCGGQGQHPATTANACLLQSDV